MGYELKAAALWIRSLKMDMEEFRGFEMDRLSAWNKKAEKMHNKIDFNSIHEVHSLRILYKKLKYATSSLELSKDKELEKFQDQLGKICDTHLNNSLLKDINSKYQLSGLKYESGILMGYQLYEMQAASEYLKRV
jgi:CHAD domain-containing protein